MDRTEYLKRIIAYSCPIPQYDATRRKMDGWYARQEASKQKENGKQKEKNNG